MTVDVFLCGGRCQSILSRVFFYKENNSTNEGFTFMAESSTKGPSPPPNSTIIEFRFCLKIDFVGMNVLSACMSEHHMHTQ